MVKPTGTLGHFTVQNGPDGKVTGSFVTINLPKSKIEIERLTVDRFLSSMNLHLAQSGERFFLSNPVANEENDFDFTVQSTNGKAFLELMEIAPLHGPYDEAPNLLNIYDFSQVIFEGILHKSQRYPNNMTSDLFLLVYVTHWTFTLSDEVISCLRYWCARTNLVFRAVFSFQSFNDDSGTPNWIFPVPPDLLADFDPEKVQKTTVLNLDPRKFEVWS